MDFKALIENAQPGDIITLSDGDWDVESTIKVPDGVTIKGTGHTHLTFTGTGPLFDVSNTDDVNISNLNIDLVLGRGVQGSNTSNFTLENVSFTGNHSQADTSNIAISLTGSKNITLSDNNISDNFGGIYVLDTVGAQIENNTLNEVGFGNIVISGSDIDVVGNELYRAGMPGTSRGLTGGDGITIYSGSDILVEDNTFEAGLCYNIWAPYGNVSDLVIKDNSFIDGITTAIRLEGGVENVLIENNYFEDNAHGISLENVSHATLRDNVLVNDTIHLKSTHDILAKDNTFKGDFVGRIINKDGDNNTLINNAFVEPSKDTPNHDPELTKSTDIYVKPGEIFFQDITSFFHDGDGDDIYAEWISWDSMSGERWGQFTRGTQEFYGLAPQTPDVLTYMISYTDPYGEKQYSQFNIIVDMGSHGFADMLTGSDQANDKLVGDEENNLIYGKDGKDTLYGGLGDDFINGGRGNDGLQGGDGDDTLEGGAGEDVLLGGSGDDYINGGAGNDRMNGGAGDDTFIDVSGHDTFIGGAGFDVVDYSTSNQGAMDIDLAAGWFSGTSVNSDTFTSIEGFVGTSYHDTLLGDAQANSFEGYDGNDRLAGREGNDTLRGGRGNDLLEGGRGNDLLEGGSGDDVMEGGEGDDLLIAGTGSDVHNGGSGFDTVDYSFVTTGSVSINLSTGESWGYSANGDTFISIEQFIGTRLGDYLAGDAHDNFFHGGAGNDTLSGRLGDDELSGDSGNDRLFGGAGNDLLLGGSGRDALYGGSGDDEMDGGSGDDGMQGGDGDDTLEGGLGNDVLLGGTGDDTLNGEAGNDRLNGGAGDDILSGGTGRDLLYGSTGDDTLLGGQDNDVLQGGDGDDLMKGGSGDDTLLGGQGHDTLTGGTGNDLLKGGSGDDRLIGHNGHDALYGGIGKDALRGDEGNDLLQGGDGDDLLQGGDDNDVLLGGNGCDTLQGGTGNDRMNGGAGTDIFIFEDDFGQDVIKGFEQGEEYLDMRLVTGIDAHMLNVYIGDQGYVIADFGGTDRIEFVDITNVADITQADFIFA